MARWRERIVRMWKDKDGQVRLCWVRGLRLSGGWSRDWTAKQRLAIHILITHLRYHQTYIRTRWGTSAVSSARCAWGPAMTSSPTTNTREPE